MNDDEEEEINLSYLNEPRQVGVGVFSTLPPPRDDNMAVWFMSHAMRQHQDGDKERFRRVVWEAKMIHGSFMASPIIGFCVFKGIQLNFKDVIVCLLEEGLDPNFQFQGRTMLHEAVRINNEKMLSFLLSLPGIDKDVFNCQSKTPVMDAAKGKPRCLKVLLESGCNIHFMDPAKDTALHHAFKARNAHRDDILACLDLLQQHAANINRSGSLDKTCVQRAIETGTPWLLTWLIHNNCDLDVSVHGVRVHCLSSSTTGVPGMVTVHKVKTPFLLACKYKNRLFAEALIAAGCQFRQDKWVLRYSRSVQNLHESLTEAFRSVDSLKQSCRKVLRRCLSTNIIAESNNLGLPSSLRCFLLCHGELVTLETSGSFAFCCKWCAQSQKKTD
ncbi:hypothetical protein PoB_007301700 [Plakobranchus ocellatus]|uniref:SOCS box domain-containing protein n=1 Tax=Plakobranchus ocellatus TaxID=259542 RepID=A0AAV4DQG1_9GAST|nr:hypothetical protein PoB_007301700 [Plakobranchus ocellatus]